MAKSARRSVIVIQVDRDRFACAPALQLLAVREFTALCQGRPADLGLLREFGISVDDAPDDIQAGRDGWS